MDRTKHWRKPAPTSRDHLVFRAIYLMMWAPSDSLISHECDLEQPVIDKWQYLLSSALIVIDVNIHVVKPCPSVRRRKRKDVLNVYNKTFCWKPQSVSFVYVFLILLGGRLCPWHWSTDTKQLVNTSLHSGSPETMCSVHTVLPVVHCGQL